MRSKTTMITTTEATDATTGTRNLFSSFLMHELMRQSSLFPSKLHKNTSGNEDVSRLK